MNLDQNDDDLVDFARAHIGQMKVGEHIKHKNMDAILDMFSKDMIEYLDKFIPDMAPKKQWCASDSVLSIYNSGSPKDMRSWKDEQWPENKYVHEK